MKKDAGRRDRPPLARFFSSFFIGKPASHLQLIYEVPAILLQYARDLRKHHSFDIEIGLLSEYQSALLQSRSENLSIGALWEHSLHSTHSKYEI
jgi:hypothetical protein